MFDRLGRRDSETPFFVEALAMCGVQIWSVKEGQQRFESHADKLINYIRYWQASGESLKASERIKTRIAQLTREGIFCGGICPYGYRLVKTGRTNNRGHEVHDLAVEPTEAAIIRRIYDYCIRFGFGSRKIASELSAHGIHNRKGEAFHPSSVKSILQRELLTGILCRGSSRSPVIPELKIIEPHTFRKAQEIVEKKRQHQLPTRITGQNLLSGNIYCGHCGGRMFASTARKSHHPVCGQADRISIYKCYNRVQHSERCSGRTSYRGGKIEDAVLKQLQEHVGSDHQRLKLYAQFQQEEFAVRKMIALQWIERVTVYSYERIELQFRELQDIQE